MKISDILKDKKKSQEPANIKTTYPNNVYKNKLFSLHNRMFSMKIHLISFYPAGQNIQTY